MLFNDCIIKASRLLTNPVKAHGGEIKIETREGEGSEFVHSIAHLNHDFSDLLDLTDLVKMKSSDNKESLINRFIQSKMFIIF
jgi:hypothetical protein